VECMAKSRRIRHPYTQNLSSGGNMGSKFVLAVAALLLLATEANTELGQGIDLTGTWSGNDSGTYYEGVSQVLIPHLRLLVQIRSG
jgi:hypothetical protein